MPTLTTYVMAGVFQANPNYGGRSGFSLGELGTTGVSIPFELGYVPRFGASGLIGHYKLGGDFDTSHYPDLLQDAAGRPFVSSGQPPRLRAGRTEAYVLVDQMLVRTGPSDTDGVMLFGGYIHASRDVSPLADHLFGGILSSAAVIGRPKDSFGAVIHRVRISGRLTQTQDIEVANGSVLTAGGAGFGFVYGPQTQEEVVDLQYTICAYRGVTLEPDFQYVIRPGATSATRNAAVVGVRTNVHF